MCALREVVHVYLQEHPRRDRLLPAVAPPSLKRNPWCVFPLLRLRLSGVLVRDHHLVFYVDISMQNVFVGAIGHGDLGCLCTTTTEHSLYNWGLTKKKRHRTLLCETGESGSMSEQPLTGAAATITHAPAYSRARTRVHPLCYTSVASRTSLSKILSGIVRRGSYRRSVVKGVFRVSWSLEANSSNS